MHLTLYILLSTLLISTSASIPNEAAQYQPPIPAPLQQFIAEFNSFHPSPQSPSISQSVPNQNQKHNKDDSNNGEDNLLKKRQKGVGGADTPLQPTSTIATQMSPVTTYMAHGKPVVFTQTFKPTPDPWGSVVVGDGEIGFGRGV